MKKCIRLMIFMNLFKGFMMQDQKVKIKKEFKWYRLWVKIYRSIEMLINLIRELWNTKDFKVNKLN